MYRVVHQLVVRVRHCIRHVCRILSDGILDQRHDEYSALHQPNSGGAYGEAISDTQNLQVDGNTVGLPRSDGGVLIKEVSGITLNLNQQNPRRGIRLRGHHGAVMATIRLSPKGEFPSLVFAELGV